MVKEIYCYEINAREKMSSTEFEWKERGAKTYGRQVGELLEMEAFSCE